MSSLRNFLKQTPVPHLLVAEYDDDGEKRVKLNDSRTRIRDAELALKGALRIEARDEEDNVLRVWEAEDATEREATATITSLSTNAADAMAMVTQVARLISESNDAAVQRHAEAFAMAYQAQTTMMTIMSERLAQLERVWQQTLMERAAELDAQPAPDAPAGPSPTEQMVQGLLMQAAMSAVAPAPAPAPAPLAPTPVKPS
jgi:phage/plasmid-associated DNA primase